MQQKRIIFGFFFLFVSKNVKWKPFLKNNKSYLLLIFRSVPFVVVVDTRYNALPNQRKGHNIIISRSNEWNRHYKVGNTS